MNTPAITYEIYVRWRGRGPWKQVTKDSEEGSSLVHSVDFSVYPQVFTAAKALHAGGNKVRITRVIREDMDVAFTGIGEWP